jgi:hypothetical protein
MIEIKKYANRRLYNTSTSSYITQEDIVTLIKKKEPFKIIDADSKKDITPAILTQIILDKETAGIIQGKGAKPGKLYYYENKSPNVNLESEAWLKDATKQEGSWWPLWMEWLKKYSGNSVEAKQISQNKFKEIYKAPGLYVTEK